MAALDPALDRPVDVERLAAARRLLGDLPAGGAYDRLARLAARLVGAPQALVCLVTDEEVVLGSYGIPSVAADDRLPVESSPCAVVASRGAPVSALDAAADDRLLDLHSAQAGHVRGFLGVPLVSDGQVVGVLSVFDPCPHPWTTGDQEALERLAASVVAELELSAANTDVTTSLHRIDVILEASSVGIWEVDLVRQHVDWDQRCAAIFGVPGPVRTSLTAVFDRFVHPDDVESSRTLMEEAIAAGAQYTVELRAVRPDGEVRWTVFRGRVLVDTDGRPIRILGTALDVSDARAEAQGRLAAMHRAAAIAEVAAEVAYATRIDDLADIVLRGAQVLGAESGGIAVRDPVDGLVRVHLGRRAEDLVRERAEDVEIVPGGIPIQLDDSLPTQWTVRTGERVLLPDLDTGIARFARMEEVGRVLGVRALASLPLRIEGRLLGAFVAYWTADHSFSDEDVDLLEGLAAQIALSVSRLQADAERDAAVREMAGANQRLQLLADVGRVLSGTLDIERQLTQLAELVVPPLGDWGWIVSVDEQGRLVEMAAAHRDPGRTGEVAGYLRLMANGLTDQGAAQIVHRTGQPLLIRELTPERIRAAFRDQAAHDAFVALEPAAVLAVPLTARGQTLGVLSLANSAQRGPNTRAELETAVEVGRRAGVALDQMRLFAAQRALADALQRSMLTDPPQPEGCEIVVRYVPAAAGAEIGGDWYDAFLQPDGSTVLAIGDVAGHDTRAAASMGQVRGLLRGISYASSRTPAAALAELDRAIDGLALDTMATALLAQLTRDSSGWARMRWASAGHPAPVVLAPDGTVRVLDAGSADLLLGVDPRQWRRDRSAELAPGSTVLLYTDGLVERRDRDIDAGTAELVTVLGEAAGLPLEELCDRLLERLFLPDAEDDVAVLALRLT